VDPGTHALRLQLRQHVVAVADAHDVEMPDVDVPRQGDRQAQAGDVRQEVAVDLGRCPALLVPAVQPAQLREQHDGLQGVEARVEADAHVLVLDRAAVCAEQANRLGQTVVIGGDGARVTVSAEVLARVEAGTGHVPPRARRPLVTCRSLRLRGVLHHCDATSLESRSQQLERGELAVEVDPDHRPGPRREGVVDAWHVDQQCVVVDIREHRVRAGPDHGLRGGDERVGRHDDLVTRADREGAQAQFEGVRAVADADAVTGPGELRVLPLEGAHCLAADEVAR
jgi:hypothetical protein